VDPRWKPFVGDITWQDIEEMWQGTKLDRTNRKHAKYVKKNSGSKNSNDSENSKQKALPAAMNNVRAAAAPNAKSKAKVCMHVYTYMHKYMHTA
jgi:hypothetical protein